MFRRFTRTRSDPILVDPEKVLDPFLCARRWGGQKLLFYGSWRLVLQAKIPITIQGISATGAGFQKEQFLSSDPRRGGTVTRASQNLKLTSSKATLTQPVPNAAGEEGFVGEVVCLSAIFRMGTGCCTPNIDTKKSE